MARFAGLNSPLDEKSRIEQIRLKCLELAKGNTPEKRIAAAEEYLAWIFTA
jgi:hypothetical protein